MMHLERPFQDIMDEAGELPCYSAPDLFFEAEGPDAALTTSTNFFLAKKLCNDCPIRQECRTYALDGNIRYGVWGQTTPSERLRIRLI